MALYKDSSYSTSCRHLVFSLFKFYPFCQLYCNIHFSFNFYSTNEVENLFTCFWQFVYHLLKSASSNLLLIFLLDYHFLIDLKFFVYYGYKPFIGYMCYEYFTPLPHFILKTRLLILVYFSLFPFVNVFYVVFLKSLLPQEYQDIPPCHF